MWSSFLYDLVTSQPNFLGEDSHEIRLAPVCGSQAYFVTILVPTRLTHWESWQLERRFGRDKDARQCCVPRDKRGNDAEPATNLDPCGPTTTCQVSDGQGQESQEQQEEYTYEGSADPECAY